MINGLTKGFRLPGWRVCWVVGPEELITAVGQSGGFLDGGSSHILQRAALPLLEPERVKSDRKALQAHFLEKRDHVLKRLRAMGFEVKNPPNSTFYIWLDLRQLPAPLSSGMVFFEECLKERVIVVPGQFFDVNPSSKPFSLAISRRHRAHPLIVSSTDRRNLLDSPCDKFVRLSFGPPLEELDRGTWNFFIIRRGRAWRADSARHACCGTGLDAIERVVTRVRQAEKANEDLFQVFGKDLKK